MNASFSHTNAKGTWYLHQKDVTLRNGREQTIYFFARDVRPGVCDLPDGYEVVDTVRTGMPVLRRVR